MDRENEYMVGSDGVHDLIFRRAYTSGQSFPTTAQRMFKDKELSRASAQSVNFTNAGVRNVELKRGFVEMGNYAYDEWAYRGKLTTRMGLKTAEKINEEIGKLKLLTQERLDIGIFGLFDRLLKRHQLEKINSIEFIGHLYDRSEFIKMFKVDIEDVGFKVGIKEIIYNIAPRLVDPALDLTTCKVGNATIAAKDKNMEIKEDFGRLINNDFGDKLPGAPPDSPIFCFNGKLIYDLDDNLRVEVVLETPLTDLYKNERYLLESIRNSNYILDTIRAGGTPHVSEDGRFCMRYNYPHADFGGNCTDPNCTGKKICMQCVASHNQRGCPLHCSSYAAISFNPDWESTPVPRRLARLHQVGRGGRRNPAPSRSGNSSRGNNSGSIGTRMPSNFKLNWDGMPYSFGLYD